MDDSGQHTATVLRELFGDHRAEWPPARFGDLFIAPAYFTKLETKRPSLLVGGRGTGKTTALRSLRFDVSLERLEAQGLHYGDLEYLGIYVRINKSRVPAFQGQELRTDQWSKAFSHYFNLLCALEMAQLAQWLEKRMGQPLTPAGLRSIAADIAVDVPASTAELEQSLGTALSALQLYINNPQSAPRPMMSLSDAPLKMFANVLQREGLTQERTIFCCIDEYENLLDEQQAIINTYIKHAEPPLSYKIGVRKNGLRTHHTTDGADLLQSPDDYAELEIASEGFELFATAVAELRLRRAKERQADVHTTLAQFLESLSFEQEAALLGAETSTERVRAALAKSDDADLVAWVLQRPITDLYFLEYWADYEKGCDIVSLARSWRANSEPWINRLNNYGYASLFWLSKGRKGARIRKYYCGARTILSLAAGNIRYFLELLDESIARELEIDRPNSPVTISPRAQTDAARAVGKRRLDQLEGLAEHGVELKRLVLAIGKVLFELARNPVGHAPEVTFFVVTGGAQARDQIERLLEEGVAHLAFEETPRTKATAPVEMRDSEYRLHRIFCAFFEISHRRKRRATFRAEDLLALSTSPSKAISALLDGAQQSSEEELPEQLAFFSSFYKGSANVSRQ
jgi:hypothetical protein